MIKQNPNTYFFYDRNDGMRCFPTQEAALADAQKTLDAYRADCEDSPWPEDDLAELCVGRITHGAEQTDVRKRPPETELEDDYDAAGNYWGPGIDSYCNYAITPVSETQETISAWAVETFGDGGSNYRCAERALEEMRELLDKLSQNDHHPGAAEEIADVMLPLFRLAQRLGVLALAEVDKKMAINRARRWHRDGTGHGYHVQEA